MDWQHKNWLDESSYHLIKESQEARKLNLRTAELDSNLVSTPTSFKTLANDLKCLRFIEEEEEEGTTPPPRMNQRPNTGEP